MCFMRGVLFSNLVLNLLTDSSMMAKVFALVNILKKKNSIN